jgi:hypothetical protein
VDVSVLSVEALDNLLLSEFRKWRFTFAIYFETRSRPGM